ncbi:type II toxin-antitoxin system VapC family toxin [Singulisphaera acidiphila]|uniref:Ribonuclease VapC n=1 Tax=Singulisphaera acidiphila (strain ATCC BAA-1392 / DSM 18658 / VKM B-2454 / MOB10) TaxID=886293 RepID=L0DHH0_SINAD|nr:type II toxin-antitoxin system VapC family toxin [Singulisphaera acidiphila]AGA28707.1 putative nucleic acid-binding protein, contains PIN domain [Singulisphaera acidiphila DSM 18658]
MPIYFLDTSALVKRYVDEVGTGWVQALTHPGAGHTHFLARITQAEMVSAVTRRERGGHIAPADAVTALADFQFDFARQYLVVEISAGLVAHATSLARRYALRGYDAVQLAAALEVQDNASGLVLLSADGDLNAAAIAEGVAVENPNFHS